MGRIKYLLIIILLSCAPERDNPYDIHSPYYREGAPKIDTAYVISIREDMGYPVFVISWVEIYGKVSDPDGIENIDSVIASVEIDTIKIIRKLGYRDGIYFGKIMYFDCPNNKLESLVGRPFVLKVADRSGWISLSEKFYLPRIIYSMPLMIYPMKEDTQMAGKPIKFIWHKITTLYSIVYRLFIRDYNTLDTVFIKDIKDTTFVIDSLPIGKYAWRSEAIDDFGDKSKPCYISFVVK